MKWTKKQDKVRISQQKLFENTNAQIDRVTSLINRDARRPFQIKKEEESEGKGKSQHFWEDDGFWMIILFFVLPGLVLIGGIALFVWLLVYFDV